jgi:hypothetical protein
MHLFRISSTLGVALGLLLVVGCSPGGDVSNLPDTDGDGLVDAFELHIGTDPGAVDTDGDYYDDYDEYSRYFDPKSADDFPYIGQYPRQALPSEPIEGSGWFEGQVSRSWSRPDQFGQMLHLNQFYGNVIMVTNGVMTDLSPSESSGIG